MKTVYLRSLLSFSGRKTPMTKQLPLRLNHKTTDRLFQGLGRHQCHLPQTGEAKSINHKSTSTKTESRNKETTTRQPSHSIVPAGKCACHAPPSCRPPPCPPARCGPQMVSIARRQPGKTRQDLLMRCEPLLVL